MGKKEKPKAGRPRKASFEEKRAIIDAFFIIECCEDAHILRKHGIYKKLADFPPSKELNLQPHDFSRDEQVLAYIQKLVDSNPQSDSPLVYEPLDISALLAKPLKQQIDILRDRERYYESICIRGSKAISSYTDIVRQRDAAIARQKELQAQSEVLGKEFEKTKAAVNMLKEETIKLKKYIKEHVEPGMADEYLKSISQLRQGQIPDVAATVVTGDEKKPAVSSGSVIKDIFISIPGMPTTPIDLEDDSYILEDDGAF